MRKRFLALWTVAVLSTGAAFVAYLALRFESVRIGYQLDVANKDHRRLSEHARMLTLEAQTLREHARVQAIAERALGMQAPDRTRVVAVGLSARAGAPAGRAR
jgi:cell division protein FtsL